VIVLGRAHKRFIRVVLVGLRLIRLNVFLKYCLWCLPQ